MNAFANPLLRNLLSGITSIKRRTWVIVAASVLLLIVLLIWATITVAGWLFGMAREGVDAAPETVRSATAHIEQIIPGVQETVRSATAQAEQLIPGIQGSLGALLPNLSAESPARDVSGTDPGPVARFPGLSRIEWQRAEQGVQVRYQGKSDIAAVIRHYAEGFAAQGFQQNLLSATPTEERHEYIKDGERFSLNFSVKERDVVTVTLSAPAS